MKEEKIKFVRRLVIFLLIIVLIILSLNAVYFGIIVPQKNIERSQIQFNQAIQEHPEIMIMGDSHAARALDPQKIEIKAFNYAFSGENYIQTQAKVKKVLEEDDGVQVFVLPIDVHSFSDYRQNPYSDEWFWINFFSVGRLSRLSNDSIAKVMIISKFPWVGNGLEFTRLIDNQEKTIIVNGWQKAAGNFGEKQDRMAIALDRVTRQLQFKDHILIQKHLWEAFTQTLDLLDSQNKTVILMRYPITEEYMAALKQKNMSMQEYYAKIDEEIERHDNIILLDKHTWNSDRPELFSDPDHLNEQGAYMFSEEISNEFNTLFNISSQSYR